MKKICVFGLGYVGLPTASMLATHGFEVLGVEIDENIIERINNGNAHIEEPGLNTLVKAAILSNNLKASSKPIQADVFIICVPTPLDSEKKSDLSYVKSAAKSAIPYLIKDNLVILESTVPPKTTEEVLIPILEESGLEIGTELFVAYCPERVIPGRVIVEMVENDRIIGGINEKSALMAKEIYQTFVEGNIFLTDATTAEFVKLIENTYRDVNIALANEFAKVAEKIHINVWNAIELANRHPRVNILKPGPGVGGHCIPVDPWFIVEKVPQADLIKLSRKINEGMVQHIFDILKETLGKEKRNITIFGVAYKGNVDDTRGSPAKRLIDLLLTKNYDVRVYDPLVRKFRYELKNLADSVKDSECIVVLADHDEFKKMRLDEISEIGKLMRKKNILDARNCLNHEIWKLAGFDVRILGNARMH